MKKMLTRPLSSPAAKYDVPGHGLSPHTCTSLSCILSCLIPVLLELHISMILTAPFLFPLKRRNSTNIVQVLFTVGKNISDHIIELEVCYNKVYYTIEKSPVHVGKNMPDSF